MTVETKPAPRPVFVPSENTANEARSAALAMLEGAIIDDSAAPVEEGEKKAPTQAAEGDQPEEVVETKPEEKPAAEEKKAEPEDKKLSDPLKNSFERLAREKAEMRKAEESLKAREAKTAKYEMLERAVENDDVLGAVSLLGLKYSTLVQQVISKGKGEEEPEEAPPAESVYEKRIAALEERLAKEQSQRSHQEMQGRINAAAKSASDRFPSIAADSALAADVVQEMLSFTMRTGRPPGDTIEESIQMAMESIESREEASLQKLLKRRGLTVQKPVSNTDSAGTKSAVVPAASELASKSRTLTNSHASAPRTVGTTTAETPEELRAKALALLEAQG